MNSTARLLILVGTGLATSALAMGPAQAGTTPDHTTVPAAQAPFDADVIGYFPAQNDCDWAGRAGKQQNRWTSYTCDRSDGMYRGLWQLAVRRFNPGGPNMPGGPHPMPGQTMPGLPGSNQPGPNQPGPNQPWPGQTTPAPGSTGSAQSNGGHPR